MELVKQALTALEQGINIATAKGAYSSAKDVSTLVKSLEILNQFADSYEQQQEATTEPEGLTNNKEAK